MSEDTHRRAVRAKGLAQQAKQELGGSAPPATQQEGEVAIGDKLSRAEVRGLRRQGYSLDQVRQFGEDSGKIGAGAQRRLDRWGRPRGTGGTGSEGRPPRSRRRDEGSSAPTRGGGENFGTADPNSWLSAELAAVDTHRPDLEPVVFNAYRPPDFSRWPKGGAPLNVPSPPDAPPTPPMPPLAPLSW